MKYSRVFYAAACNKSAGGMSLAELLIVLIIAGSISITGIKSLAYIKKHEISIQSFLLRESNLFETQIFINKQLAISKIDTISIAKNRLQWESYQDLYKAGDNDGIMDFSTDTTTCILEILNGNLYYNGAILLPHAVSLESNITNNNDLLLLEYTLCDVYHCVNDFVPLSDSEINI